jgi:hypothetical protein
VKCGLHGASRPVHGRGQLASTALISRSDGTRSATFSRHHNTPSSRPACRGGHNISALVLRHAPSLSAATQCGAVEQSRGHWHWESDAPPRSSIGRAHPIAAESVATCPRLSGTSGYRSGLMVCLQGCVASPGAECLADAINRGRVRLIGLVMRVQVAWLHRWRPPRGCHRGPRSRLRSSAPEHRCAGQDPL